MVFEAEAGFEVVSKGLLTTSEILREDLEFFKGR